MVIKRTVVPLYACVSMHVYKIPGKLCYLITRHHPRQSVGHRIPIVSQLFKKMGALIWGGTFLLLWPRGWHFFLGGGRAYSKKCVMRNVSINCRSVLLSYLHTFLSHTFLSSTSVVVFLFMKSNRKNKIIIVIIITIIIMETLFIVFECAIVNLATYIGCSGLNYSKTKSKFH